jgi:Domain of unknown function (DUF4375)
MLRSSAEILIVACLLLPVSVVPCVAQQPAAEANAALPASQEDALHHIPDYDVLLFAYPPNTAILAAISRQDYFAKISHDPTPVQRVRLLLGFSEYMHEGTAEAVHAYFSSPAGTLAPELLLALREAGMPERARVIEDAIALFGPAYPIDDAKRSDFFAQSFLRIKDGIIPDLTKPPTETDIKLKELGKRFTGKAKFRVEIEAYAHRDPVLATALKEARDKLSDEDRLTYLYQQLLPGPSGFGDAATIRKSIEAMPPGYHTVYVLTLLADEMFNGGMHQFFSNSSGAFAEYAAQALRDVGNAKAAAVVDKGIAMFPKPYPVSTEDRRRKAFQHDWNAWDDKLDALTGEIDGENLRGATAAYARKLDILPR